MLWILCISVGKKMNSEIANKLIFPFGLKHLPGKFDSTGARAMLLAIALQETNFLHRVQLVAGRRHWWESLSGPARGWWQFEVTGVSGVLNHHATSEHATSVLQRLRYPADVAIIHKAIAHNDALAAVFARLLLFTVPQRLPTRFETDEAWQQYLWAWRPGKPHPERWSENYALAWRIVTGET